MSTVLDNKQEITSVKRLCRVSLVNVPDVQGIVGRRWFELCSQRGTDREEATSQKGRQVYIEKEHDILCR